MGIISFLLLGLIAGAIAKKIYSGPAPGGLLGTLAVGAIGALVGGVVASAAGLGGLDSFFSLGSWVIAIVGALAMLWLYARLVARGGHQAHA